MEFIFEATKALLLKTTPMLVDDDDDMNTKIRDKN